MTIGILACGGRERQTDRGRDQTDFSSTITTGEKEFRAFAGYPLEVILKIKNTGSEEWSSAGENPVLVSYHLLDNKGDVLKYDNQRTVFPRKIPPGETIELPVRIKAPLESGMYQLEFDLVREGIAWFKEGGSKTLTVSLQVEKKRWPEDERTPDLAYGKYTKFISSIPEFEKLQELIRITLNHNEREFQGRTGKVSGFTAGSGYPQIWLRDAASILPASRYFYSEGYLNSWIEEHLAYQKEDGSLEDWIDSQGRSDKNTTETDQETSAVQAAYQVFLIKGERWLRKEVAGQALIERLERSLQFLFSHRFNEKYGLVVGAHTADWGDVDMVDADQQAIYVDEKTHWTADIYDQSMLYEACQNLASMLEATGRAEKSEAWRVRASRLKKNANQWLWQEKRGFYRVHIHLDSLSHGFDEDDMFAMGGNAQAVLSGLADGEKPRRIIEEALRRQRQFHISTISGCLLPPYPQGFFKHPALDELSEYQNGGQWDWFGGRLIYAMFENGMSSRGKEKLLEVIKKNLANEGFYEWDTPGGEGRGSDYYAGSAGALSRALFEGYFGFSLGEGGVSLRPRLGRDEAQVHIYLSASDLFIAYEYRPNDDEKEILFRFNSNSPEPGKIQMLLPRDFFGLGNQVSLKGKLEVMLDGKKVPYEMMSLHEDDYLVLETDLREHTLLVRPYFRPIE